MLAVLKTPAGTRQIDSHRWKVILHCPGLLLFVIFAFFPVLNNDFIFYDDPGYVIENPHFQPGLPRENFKWALVSTEGGNWHPMTRLCEYRYQKQLGGPGPAGRCHPGMPGSVAAEAGLHGCA